MNKPLISSLTHALVAFVFTVMPLQQAQSAPGTLPSAPLFLSTIVEPNVFFTLDDSTSMKWVTIVDPNLGGITMATGLYAGTPTINGRNRFYYHPDWHTHRDVVPPVSLYAEAWILKSIDGNKLYYNPDVTYLPWSGTDASGNPLYREFPPTAVPEDPNAPTANLTDLTANHTYDDGNVAGPVPMYLPTYYEWVDDGDGTIHATLDKGNPVEIRDAAGLQNFANWFAYYRSREFTAKAAIGGVINNSDAARMGLAVINDGHQFDAATMTDPDNKRKLLSIFYNIKPSGRTPLRKAVEAVGNMFKVDGSSPASPILSQALGGECQQNFNIVMTDGYWNGNNPSVGNTDQDSSSVTDNGFDGDANESVDDGYYEDTYSNTLADVAMHYYETDLAPALLDDVPTLVGIDEASQQHLVTYGVSFGVTGSLDPKTQNPTDVGFAWPDPTASDENTIDDLWHAAYNGRGKYLAAQNSTELQSALSESIADISERTGTAAAVAVNSAKLSTESVVYLAQFNTNRWQGNLFAYPIIDTDTGELAATAKWDASSALTLRDLSGKPRTIISYDASTSAGVPFQWSDISADMKLDLNTNPTGGTDADAVGEARLDYIRGDRSNEGAGYAFRERISLLGDLVNSGPVFVGQPGLDWPDYAPFPVGTEAYSEFKNGSAATRRKIVYAGANDGMLHAFDDVTGEEVFGYIPGMAYSQTVNKGLHYLSDPNYIHNYYVDLSPAVSDVYISSGSSTEWHTILIGGMRAGGRGYFGLDVTNPAAFSEAKAADMVLWEFTSDDDPDMGYSYSRPFIGLANDTGNTWVAIFGNGYNDTGSGEAALFIGDSEAGVDGTWTLGTDYKKISTGVGTPADPNGLATPALADIDGNGTIDRVYAGDLFGNMWAFDLSSTNASLWDVAYKSGSTPAPLFTTQSNEPITTKPVLASHPTQPDSGSPSNLPNIMVYFGSGQYLVNADKTSTNLQSFYGVWDKGDDSLTATDLIEQTFDGSYSGRVLTRNPVDYATDYGWYFNLTDTGERSVTSPIARADTVFFNSFVPEDDPCSAGGYGYKFAVDMATGGSPLKPVIDSNNDGVIDENDYQNNGVADSTLAAIQQDGFLPEPVFIEDLAFTAEVATKVKALLDVPSGRFSWQELLQ